MFVDKTQPEQRPRQARREDRHARSRLNEALRHYCGSGAISVKGNTSRGGEKKHDKFVWLVIVSPSELTHFHNIILKEGLRHYCLSGAISDPRNTSRGGEKK